ncbi:MAG: histidinol-phosphatase HisJ family protein [Phycisphaerales bacterium]
MRATYHNHTTWSDGKASVEELVAHARRLGVNELGISDHLTLPPAGEPPRWSMCSDDLPAYVEEVAAYGFDADMPVRLGIELDWFDSQESQLREVVNRFPFDYIVGSVHFVGRFPVDGNPHRWDALTQDDIDAIHRGYWERMARMAASGIFTIAAHLDLPKKFNHHPSTQPWDVILPALDALAAAKVVVELNTSGWAKACEDAYPSEEILRACCERSIAVTLSADAHDPLHLLRDFGRGAERLQAAGYNRIARFMNRRIRFDVIDESVIELPEPPAVETTVNAEDTPGGRDGDDDQHDAAAPGQYAH